MELKAEQIKKGLVCCTSFDDLCGECPIDQNKKDDCSCALFLEQNALALITSQEQRIKQLTEEAANWRIDAENYREELLEVTVSLKELKRKTKEKDFYGKAENYSSETKQS